MGQSALECSLALMRAPHLCMALRTTPVPDDTGLVLDIAAGSAAAVDLGTRASGASAEQLIEAARFYVREVLLFPEADAYRVLGLQWQADSADIKRHYRALQRWLHPDRARDNWEAAFAARVNQAWSQLRTDKARARYDAKRMPAPSTCVELQAGAAGLAGMYWRRVARQGTRGRVHPALPVGGVMLICLGLVVLITQRDLDDSANRSSGAGLGDSMAAPRPSPDSSVVQRDESAGDTSKRPAVLPLASREAVGNERQARAAEPNAPTLGGPLELPPADSATNLGEDPDGSPSRYSKGGRNTAVTRQVPPEVEDSPLETVGNPPVPDDAAPLGSGVDDGTAEFGSALRRGAQLLAYLEDADAGAPPIWNSVASMEAAQRARFALQHAARGRLSWQNPQWRISRDRAQLSVEVRTGSWLRRTRPGRVEASLRWREGDWRVDEVFWEQAR